MSSSIGNYQPSSPGTSLTPTFTYTNTFMLGSASNQQSKWPWYWSGMKH
jgi:hypothetical protein